MSKSEPPRLSDLKRALRWLRAQHQQRAQEAVRAERIRKSKAKTIRETPRKIAVESQERLLTPQEVAQHLGVSRWTVGEMAREGTLPAVRVGRFLRFTLEDVRKYVERHREG